jgi:hypothetical protein
MEGEMTHISPEALKRLYARDPDVVLCLHGLQTRLSDDHGLAMVRIVGHLVLEEVPAEDGDPEIPEDMYLVLDLPMDVTRLTLVSGHIDETMGPMVESALERLITEDGDT